MGKVKKIKLLDNSEYDIEDASAAHIQTVTLVEWNALTPEQQASGDYVVTGVNASPLSASLIPYDNTLSGLAATTAQGAIDEVDGAIPANSDFSLSGLSDTTINNPSSGQVLSYDNGKWKNNDLLVSNEGVGYFTAVNDTIQIPNDVLAKSIIVIVLRRYGYFGTIAVSRSQLTQGTYSAGTQVYGQNNISWQITISNTGVITLSDISGTAYPIVDCYGLF